MVPQLLQPSCYILVSLVLANIVHQQGSYCSSVVGRCNGSISLLSSSIPDLCLDCLCVYLDGSGRELHTDSRFGIEVELIAGETTQEVRFTNTRVSDQNHYT
jgi:hypothetical protein